MFETAKELMRARQDVLNHDRALLSRVEEGGLHPDEAWSMLVDLQSDMTRVYACEVFLSELLGPGKIDRASDVQLRFVQSKFSYSFRLGDKQKCRVTVSFEDCHNLRHGLLQPTPYGMSAEETMIGEYISALKSKAPCSAKSKIRIPDSFAKGPVAKLLYYLFVVSIQDFIHGRKGVSYWENQVSLIKACRDTENSKLLAEWAKRWGMVHTFQIGAFMRLEQLGVPIYLGEESDALPADDVFSCDKA